MKVAVLKVGVAVLMSEFAVFSLNVAPLRLKVAGLMSEFAALSLNVAPLRLEVAALSLNVAPLRLKIAAFLSHAKAQRRKEEESRVCCRVAQRTTHHLKYFTLYHHTSFPHSPVSYTNLKLPT
ncbi:hypothetical protein IQ278_05725, partial [Tolypothrix sp. LEGE 11397]|nr:hypothetical protein [Tolypothrix sp. LEGE 11397]